MKKFRILLIFILTISLSVLFIAIPQFRPKAVTPSNVYNNEIEWVTCFSVLDSEGDPVELQVAKIMINGVLKELSYNNLQSYNIGMPDNIFQMYLLDSGYNHYFINSLDYVSWYDQLYLPLGNYQMFSMSGAPVKMSFYSYYWGDNLDVSIDAFLSGYPNNSGNWYFVRNIKTVNQYSYDYGYEDGYEDGYDYGFPLGRQQGYDMGVDKGFNDGVASATDYSFFGLITQVFAGLGSFLAIELLPRITIGALLAVPLVFGIISFIIGKRGGKDD